MNHLLQRSPFGSKRFFKARAFYWFVFYSVVFPRYFIVLLIQISGYLLMRRLWRGLANFPIRSWSHNNLKQTKIIYNFIYVDKKLACSTSKVFAILSYICYFHLLSFDDFFLEKKNSGGCLLKIKWMIQKLNIVIWTLEV